MERIILMLLIIILIVVVISVNLENKDYRESPPEGVKETKDLFGPTRFVLLKEKYNEGGEEIDQIILAHKGNGDYRSYNGYNCRGSDWECETVLETSSFRNYRWGRLRDDLSLAIGRNKEIGVMYGAYESYDPSYIRIIKPPALFYAEKGGEGQEGFVEEIVEIGLVEQDYSYGFGKGSLVFKEDGNPAMVYLKSNFWPLAEFPGEMRIAERGINGDWTITPIVDYSIFPIIGRLPFHISTDSIYLVEDEITKELHIIAESEGHVNDNSVPGIFYAYPHKSGVNPSPCNLNSNWVCLFLSDPFNLGRVPNPNFRIGRPVIDENVGVVLMPFMTVDLESINYEILDGFLSFNYLASPPAVLRTDHDLFKMDAREVGMLVDKGKSLAEGVRFVGMGGNSQSLFYIESATRNSNPNTFQCNLNLYECQVDYDYGRWYGDPVMDTAFGISETDNGFIAFKPTAIGREIHSMSYKSNGLANDVEVVYIADGINGSLGRFLSAGTF
jgi:hypothetical protein